MPPDTPLDPCRQWLGVDAADLGDHRRVLGLSPDERDPLKVLRAAEARLAALRGVSAGPLEVVRAGFVKRVEAARESLLAEISAVSPDPAASGTSFRRPPPPSTLPAAPPAVSAPPRVPVAPPPPVPRPPVPPPAVPTPAIAADINAGPAPITVRTTVYRKKTPVVGITLAMLGLSALAGGLGYYVLVLKPTRSAQPDRRPSVGDEDALDETPGVAAAPAGGGKGLPAADEMDRPPPRARPRRPRSSDAAGPAKEAEPSTAAARDVPAPGPRPAAVTMAKPRPETAAEDASREEARRLDETLAKVLETLRSERHDGVESLLKTAAEHARSPDGRRRVTGWQRLAASHRQYVESRAAALDAVEPGATYDVGGRKVVIEKIDGGQCVFRAGGPPKTVPREKIPAGIVMAIVSAWTEGDAAGDLANAAFQIVRPEPELRLAREWLDKGREAGADVEPLIALLDDPLLAAGEGT